MKNKKAHKDFLSPAPEGYRWPRCPEADGFVQKLIAAFLEHHAFAARLAEAMTRDASAPFPVSFTPPNGRCTSAPIVGPFTYVMPASISESARIATLTSRV